MDRLWQDLRTGIRLLIKSPGFTAIAVLSLALGIGANSAIFSLVDKVILRSMPVDQPERLVTISVRLKADLQTVFTYPDYIDFHDHTDFLAGLIAYYQTPFNLSASGQTDRVNGLVVSGNYFSMLGVTPAPGRGFLPEEDARPDTHPVVIISHGLWRRNFGADPRVIGRTITLNGASFTVVGVAPAEFTSTIRGFVSDIYVPMMMLSRAVPDWGKEPLTDRSMAWVSLLGRLKTGVSRPQAEAAMNLLGSQMAQANPYPDGSKAVAPKLVLQDGSKGQLSQVRDLSFPLLLLMAVVALTLLIACANVANLLLTRSAARRKEVAIRLVVGASRGRIIQQLLTESVLLSLLAALAALALAAAISRLMVSFTPPGGYTPLTLDSSLDRRALAFTLIISVLTGIVFGLAPALSISNPDLVPSLKEETISFGSVGRRLSLRNLLVIVQMALSLIVLIGAGLCVRSLKNLESIDAGFDPAKVLVMSFDLGLNGYDQTHGQQVERQLLERARALPEVESASIAAIVPLGGTGMVWLASPEGYKAQRDENMMFRFNSIEPQYFKTMGTAFVRGRDFTAQDGATAPRVAIVNLNLANRYWSGQDPIGKKIRLGGSASSKFIFEVVGVVRDSKYKNLTEAEGPEIYAPWQQRFMSEISLLMRTTGNPAAMLSAVRQAVKTIDPDLPVYNLRTLAQQKNNSLYSARLTATLLTIFGLIALLLSVIGLYGIMAYSVTQRTREIGIRIALGAQRGDVLRLILRDGTILILIGLAVGTVGALAATRLARSFLYGISPTDPATFIGIGVLLALVAMSASLLPARKAAKVDPMVALRYE